MSNCEKDSCGDSNAIPGDPRTTKSRVLETGASMVQDFTPVKQICAHLNAFHVYANDPTRCVEANHYCTHLTEGTSQYADRHSEYRTIVLSLDIYHRRPPMSDLRLTKGERPPHRRGIHGYAAHFRDSFSSGAEALAYARVRGQEWHAYYACAGGHAESRMGSRRDG